MFDTASNPPIFGFSVTTKDAMTFSGGAITGSSDTPRWLGVGTQTHHGGIQSNSSSRLAVTLSGTANLDGQVNAVGGIKNSASAYSASSGWIWSVGTRGALTFLRGVSWSSPSAKQKLENARRQRN